MESQEDYFHLGVKALIHNNESKFLLLERNLCPKKTYWDMPRGRLKKDETLNISIKLPILVCILQIYVFPF